MARGPPRARLARCKPPPSRPSATAAPFFAGVIELSSVPLVAVDFFHPKHFQQLAEASPALGALNAAARVPGGLHKTRGAARGAAWRAAPGAEASWG